MSNAPAPTINASELLAAARAAYLRGEVDSLVHTYGELPPERPLRGDFWTDAAGKVFVWNGRAWAE